MDEETRVPVGGLSVVIPTRNRCDTLPALLERVLADEGVAEVVVVDDASTDGTADYLRSAAERDARLRRVPGPGRGPLVARTVGVEASTSDVTLLLDDDVEPVVGLCSGHLAHHADGARRLVLGYMPTVVADPPARVPVATRLYAAEYEGRCEQYEQDAADVLRHLWMGNLSVRRETFLEVTSGWPAPLPGFRHEDTEIGLRLASVGVVPLFDRSLLAVHRHRRTLPQFRRDNQLDGRGLAELDRDGRDVFGPAGVDRFSRDLGFPLRQVVRAARQPPGYRVTSSLLALVTAAAGATGAVGAEVRLARLLRRVERQHGYLLQTAAA